MSKFCPRCDQSNPPEAAFCLNCASPLGAAPPPQAYPQTPGGASQKGTVALALAIAALLCCGPFAGIPAAVVGWMELDAIKNGRSPGNNKWMAAVGLWGGIAATLIHAGIYVLWVLMGMISSVGDPYYY